MNGNVTTIILLGILGIVAYKLISSPHLGGLLPGSPTASPTGGSAGAGTSSGQSDFAAVLGTITAIVNASDDFISQPSPKTN